MRFPVESASFGGDHFVTPLERWLKVEVDWKTL